MIPRRINVQSLLHYWMFMNLRSVSLFLKTTSSFSSSYYTHGGLNTVGADGKHYVKTVCSELLISFEVKKKLERRKELILQQTHYKTRCELLRILVTAYDDGLNTVDCRVEGKKCI